MPTVKIIHANPTDWVKNIKASDITIQYKDVDKDQISTYLNNEFLAQPRFDIYGFFLNNDSITETGLMAVIAAFGDMKEVGAVYTDKFLRKDNKLIPQFYPPYEVNSRFVFNPTIFVNGHINNPIFDKQLNHLRFFDALRKIGQASRIIHIPSLFITSDLELGKIDDELKHVWATN